MLRAMPAENRLVLARARESRDRVIAALSEHFAHDAIDVDEFERRITVGLLPRGRGGRAVRGWDPSHTAQGHRP